MPYEIIWVRSASLFFKAFQNGRPNWKDEGPPNIPAVLSRDCRMVGSNQGGAIGPDRLRCFRGKADINQPITPAESVKNEHELTPATSHAILN
jgi:hypothetical protein